MRRTLTALALVLATGAARAQERPLRERVREVERHVQQLIAAAEPGVVAVVVSHSPRYPAEPPRGVPGQLGHYPGGGPLGQGGVGFDPKLDLADPLNVADNAFGSGVVLDAAKGLVLTNYHLVDGARKVYVRTAAGRGSYADIHAADARSDLAVLRLQLPPAGLRTLKIAEGRTGDGPRGEPANLVRGMGVVALGHANAADAADGVPGASWGVLSNVRRRAGSFPREDAAQKPLHQFGSLLQTDARLTLGSSGTALLNLDGELIGLAVPTAALTGADSAGGYAIPMDPNYRRIVAVLREGREVEYGFLGVSLPRGAERGRPDGGLPILEPQPGGPAKLAGLAPNDVILAVDGQPVREPDDLFLTVGAALAGSRVSLKVLRYGQPPFVAEATLTKFRHGLPTLASARPAAVFGLRVDYPNHQNGAGNRAPPAGVSVRELEPGSAAEGRFKRLGEAPIGGWLVTEVNGRPVAAPRDFAALTAGATSIKLKVTDPGRPGAEQEVDLP